jgi:S-layer homology domain.
MKRRVLATLLCVCMVLTLLPTMAFAALLPDSAAVPDDTAKGISDLTGTGSNLEFYGDIPIGISPGDKIQIYVPTDNFVFDGATVTPPGDIDGIVALMNESSGGIATSNNKQNWITITGISSWDSAKYISIKEGTNSFVGVEFIPRVSIPSTATFKLDNGIKSTAAYTFPSIAVGAMDRGNITKAVSTMNLDLSLPEASRVRTYSVRIYNYGQNSMTIDKLVDILPIYETYVPGSATLTNYNANGSTAIGSAIALYDPQLSAATAADGVVDINNTGETRNKITFVNFAAKATGQDTDTSNPYTLTTGYVPGYTSTDPYKFVLLTYKTKILDADMTKAVAYLKSADGGNGTPKLPNDDTNCAAMYLKDNATIELYKGPATGDTGVCDKKEEPADGDWDGNVNTSWRYQAAAKVNILTPKIIPTIDISAVYIEVDDVTKVETYRPYTVGDVIFPGQKVAWELTAKNNTGATVNMVSPQLIVTLPAGASYEGIVSAYFKGVKITLDEPDVQEIVDNARILVWDLKQNFAANDTLKFTIDSNMPDNYFGTVTANAYLIPNGEMFFGSDLTAYTNICLEVLGDVGTIVGTPTGAASHYVADADQMDDVIGLVAAAPIKTITELNADYTPKTPLNSQKSTDAVPRTIEVPTTVTPFRYTLELKNKSAASNYENVTFIDRLPTTLLMDDFTSVGRTPRYSEAGARIADNNGNFTAWVENASGTKIRDLTPNTDFVVQFSTAPAEEAPFFNEGDWNQEGIATATTWLDALPDKEAVTAIRISLIGNTAKTILKPGETLKVTFDVQFRMDGLQSGKIAFNSFGYGIISSLAGQKIKVTCESYTVGAKANFEQTAKGELTKVIKFVPGETPVKRTFNFKLQVKGADGEWLDVVPARTRTITFGSAFDSDTDGEWTANTAAFEDLTPTKEYRVVETDAYITFADDSKSGSGYIDGVNGNKLFSVLYSMNKKDADSNNVVVFEFTYENTTVVNPVEKPMVVSVSPYNNAINVANSGNISITFNKTMNTTPGTVTLNNGGVVIAPGTWSNNNTVYTVDYLSLAGETKYNISIVGFKDMEGNKMDADNANSFTTKESFSSGGGSTTPTQPTTKIGGVDVNYSINNNGVVTLKPTTAQLDALLKAIGENGVLNITVSGISGMKSASIEIDLTKLIASDKLQVFLFSVLGHEIRFPVGALESMRKFATTLRFGVAPGSIVFGLTDANGKTINWYDYQNPVTVSMPFTAPQDISTHQIVMIDKSDDTIIPRSWYADGSVSAKVCEPGTYDAKIVPLAAFADTNGKWMAEAVGYMGARGIVEGVGNNLFDAQGTITRAHFVTMLMRALNFELDYEEAMPPEDFENTPEWTKESIRMATALGLTLRDVDGNFNPNAPILRQDMFFMAYEAMAVCGMLPSAYTQNIVPFTDWNDVESEHADAIQNLAKLKLVNGNGDGTLNPNGQSTRSEGAQFLYNILKYDAK